MLMHLSSLHLHCRQFPHLPSVHVLVVSWVAPLFALYNMLHPIQQLMFFDIIEDASELRSSALQKSP